MCGLVGMAGQLTAAHDKIMRQLLILDSIRGEDSTGLAGVSKWDNTVRVAKQLGGPFDLFQDKRYDAIMGRINKVLIGHNRYATSGKVTRAAAHPFEFDTLVGVHNGTLSSKHKLLNPEYFSVDSENLYYHIEERGLDDALAQLGGYGNAWALVWWDKQAHTINFLRNEERPLYFTRDTKGQVMYWASEAWMLVNTLSRNNIEFEQPFQIEPDLLHTIHIDNNGVMSKPAIRKAAAPKPVADTTTKTTHSGENKVRALTVVKAGDIAANNNNIPCDPHYLKAKHVVYEIVHEARDSDGNQYYALFDDNRPYDEIRLYSRKGDSFGDLMNGLITADVSGWISYPRTPNKGYYKVSPWSVKEVKEPIKKKDSQTKSLFPTHKGSFVEKAVWEQMYNDCAWCSSPLLAEDDNVFTTGGQCLCHACAKDDLATQHVTLIH